MPRRKKHNIFAKIFLFLLFVALVIVGVLAYQYYYGGKETVPDSDSVIAEQPNENGLGDADIDESTSGGEADEKTTNDSDGKVVSYEGDNPNTAANLSGVITYAGVSGKNLIIRVNIDQFLSSGTCALTLSRNGATEYSASANLIADISTSTCEGFSVPTSSLVSGTYQIAIKISSSSKTGIITGEVSL